MRSSMLLALGAVGAAFLLASPMVANAQIADSGTKAGAERAVQNYLALWSSDGNFSAAVVKRFYAPSVTYYGKTFSRPQLLAEKLAYARQWPVRHYREVPGSLAAQCNGDRSLCKVHVVMAWNRVSRNDAVSAGRARLLFEFVPTEGSRKIAREGAVILH